MRISKLILSAFVVGILMTAFISCEKSEYVQPDRDVVTQQETGSDRDNDTHTDTGMCGGNDDGREDDGNCGGGG